MHLVIGAVIDAEAVISLLKKEGVSGVGTEGGKGRHPASVHEDPGVGDVFRGIFTLRMDIGEKKTRPLGLGIKTGVAVPVEKFGGMHDIGG